MATTPLGDLLRRRREAARLSRGDVDRRFGIPASTVETWETGRTTNPGVLDVYALAAALDVEPLDFWEALEASVAALRAKPGEIFSMGREYRSDQVRYLINGVEVSEETFLRIEQQDDRAAAQVIYERLTEADAAALEERGEDEPGDEGTARRPRSA